MEADKIVIDTEKLQIDRSTLVGKVFDDKAKEADAEVNPAKSQLMNQLLAYTEACLVIDGTVSDPKEKENMLSQLRGKVSKD